MHCRGFTKTEFLVVLIVMIILMGCVGAVLPLQFLAILLFGWAWHVYRLVGLVRIDWPELAGAAFLLSVFGLGLHWFCSWFASAKSARQNSETSEFPEVDKSIAIEAKSLWRPKWTVAIVAVVLLMFIAGISMVGVTHQVAWLFTAKEPLLTSGMEAARRSHSQNNLKQMGIGLVNYHDTLGNFPPGATSDGEGKLLHGWMATLLPYVEQNQLAEKIDYKLPWSDPANEKSMKTIVKSFALPYSQVPHRDAKEYALAGYASNQHLIGGTGPGLKMDQIGDGTSNTLLAGEAFGNYKPWGHPRNWRDPALGINQSPEGFGGPRKSGGVMVLADGSTRHLSAETDPAVMKALATPSGGEPLPADMP